MTKTKIIAGTGSLNPVNISMITKKMSIGSITATENVPNWVYVFNVMDLIILDVMKVGYIQS
jgi:hypothetical protein